MDNYKAYSLQEVDTWVRESLEADCTPKEIYDSIVDTVKNNMKYHRACYRDSVKLLSLLRGSKHEFEIIENNYLSEECAYCEGRLDGNEFDDSEKNNHFYRAMQSYCNIEEDIKRAVDVISEMGKEADDLMKEELSEDELVEAWTWDTNRSEFTWMEAVSYTHLRAHET